MNKEISKLPARGDRVKGNGYFSIDYSLTKFEVSNLLFELVVGCSADGATGGKSFKIKQHRYGITLKLKDRRENRAENKYWDNSVDIGSYYVSSVYPPEEILAEFKSNIEGLGLGNCLDFDFILDDLKCTWELTDK
jgi:hypothetical protein